MIQIKIERFGGNINPDNSINLSVVVELSAEIEGKILSKTEEIQIPPEEDAAEIYSLVYQLQPLVYEYCQSVILTPNPNP